MRRKWWLKVRARRWWRELVSWGVTTLKLLFIALALFGAWTILTSSGVPAMDMGVSTSGTSTAEDHGGTASDTLTATPSATPSPSATPETTDRDSDGDTLPNSLEADLGSASEWRKDIYVVVVYGANTEPLTNRQIEELEQQWSDMPVPNPNGDSGVRLHLIGQQRVSQDIVWSRSTFTQLREEYYTKGRLGEWHCRAHMVVIGDSDDANTWGYATNGGHFVAIDGTDEYTFETGVTFETLGITHELLHNVVGPFPDAWGNVTASDHTRGGYLSHGDSYDQISYLSSPTTTILTQRGFYDLRDNTLNAC